MEENKSQYIKQHPKDILNNNDQYVNYIIPHLLKMYTYKEKLAGKIYIKLLPMGKRWTKGERETFLFLFSDLNLIGTFYKENLLLDN